VGSLANEALSGLICAAGVAGGVCAGLRWLRVSQREHYIPGRVLVFAWRWWLGRSAQGVNKLWALLAILGVALSPLRPLAALATAIVAGLGPVGMGLKGRTSPLAWTARLRSLALASLAVDLLVSGLIALGAAAGGLNELSAAGLGAGLFALLVPFAVEAGGALMAPAQERSARSWIRKARFRLEQVNPTVVGITGSFGKTTTKSYLARLLEGSMRVVASPASFNNRLGLARAVNENLADATEVFIAEMGTYGPGEIAAMCEWLHPRVSVICAIGPVHLERMKSEERILQAKSEILQGAEWAVLNVDDWRLAKLANAIQSGEASMPEVSKSLAPAGSGAPFPKRVVRCSGGGQGVEVADVVVLRRSALEVEVRWRSLEAGQRCESSGEGTPDGPRGGEPSSSSGELRSQVVTAPPQDVDLSLVDLSLALGVVLALGLSLEDALERVALLRVPSHRLEEAVSPSGVVVLDDTYNANPLGARRALARLQETGSPEGRKVLVTPGMVELGPRQRQENSELGKEAVRVCSDLVVVGRTNRAWLTEGVQQEMASSPEGSAKLRIVLVDRREQAVAWVRENLGPGDAVLYLNDLPDHFP
jgi:UDP-N-acetylmuramoyl-tripeptide--D-alanyl-D-alanine ligase